MSRDNENENENDFTIIHLSTMDLLNQGEIIRIRSYLIAIEEPYFKINKFVFKELISVDLSNSGKSDKITWCASEQVFWKYAR